MIDERSSSSITKKKRFLSPRRGSSPQPSDDWWDALTIELSILRWQTNMQVRDMCDLSGSHNMLIMLLIRYIFWKYGSLEISWIIYLQICRTCTFACYLGLGHSVVTASHQSSEGCGFDLRLGLWNRFSEDRVYRHSSVI